MGEGRDEDGKFLPGNRFWLARSSSGAKPKFEDPDELLRAAYEYFEHTHANPIMSAETVKFQGHGELMEVPKMQAMTLTGLCLFIDVSMETWSQWRKNRADLSDVIGHIEAVIYHQKFTAAAADLLNANIISRELGLADKINHGGHDGGALVSFDASKLPTDALEALLNARQPDPDEG